MERLKGKNILITGASSGIGQAIAVRFAREGANVAINYRSGAEQADVSNSDRSSVLLDPARVNRQDLVESRKTLFFHSASFLKTPAYSRCSGCPSGLRNTVGMVVGIPPA